MGESCQKAGSLVWALGPELKAIPRVSLVFRGLSRTYTTCVLAALQLLCKSNPADMFYKVVHSCSGIVVLARASRTRLRTPEGGNGRWRESVCARLYGLGWHRW
jgi:hypothetical protein